MAQVSFQGARTFALIKIMQIINEKKDILCLVLSSRIFEISKKENILKEKRREEKRGEDGRRRREVVFDY